MSGITTTRVASSIDGIDVDAPVQIDVVDGIAYGPFAHYVQAFAQDVPGAFECYLYADGIAHAFS